MKKPNVIKHIRQFLVFDVFPTDFTTNATTRRGIHFKFKVPPNIVFLNGVKYTTNAPPVVNEIDGYISPIFGDVSMWINNRKKHILNDSLKCTPFNVGGNNAVKRRNDHFLPINEDLKPASFIEGFLITRYVLPEPGGGVPFKVKIYLDVEQEVYGK